MVGVSFSICSLFFVVIICFFYFRKPRIKSTENNVYAALIVCSLVGLIFDILGYIVFTYFFDNPVLIMIFSKISLIYYFSWLAIFTLYIFVISFGREITNQLKISLFLFYLACVFAIILLPLSIHNGEDGAFNFGMATNFVYVISSIFIIFILYCLFVNFKRIKKTRFLPLFVFIIFGSIVMVIQFLNPTLLLLITAEAIVTCLMYHTVENPDVKIMEELYKNKRIIESNAESTSNFLFKLSQDMKLSVNEINLISSKKSDEDLMKINILGKNLNHIINDTLDVSSMASMNEKVYNSKYNPKNLFDEVKVMTENKMSRNIKFEYNLCSNIPPYVYGDSIKVKQILSSVLENSIRHAKEGFISFDVNTIIKYDTCRFNINITDSGEGISIDKVNEILSLEALPKESDLDKVVLNLIKVRSLVNQIGGSFMIKSEKNKGTMVNIVLDQKIYEANHQNKEINKKLMLYESTLNKGSNIMVVDDDAKELSDIKKYLETKGMHVSSSLYGKDTLQKLNENYKFDLIILDDETNTDSALTVLRELQKNKSFNIPVIVMINDNKEFIKKHYLKDGFTDIIKKSDLKKELDRVLNENL